MNGDIPYWGANGVVGRVGDWLFDEELVLLGEDGAPFDDPNRDVAFLVNEKVWVNNHIHVLRPFAGTDARFLVYALNSVDWMRHVGGSTRLKLTQDDMLAVKLPNIPLADQRSIADYLDAETARIGALIAKKQQLIHLLSERHAAVVERELGSSSWPRLRLKHVCEGVTVGVVVNPSSYFVDVGVPFIHGTDIDQGRFDQTQLKFLSVESNSLLQKSQVRAGDVLAMRVGEPGRAAVVPPELDGSNCASVLILRRGRVLDPHLLAGFLNSVGGRSQIGAVQYGAAQGVMNVSDAVNLLVPVPPRSEQETLLAVLEKAERTFANATALLERQIGLLAEHRQALIAACITGEFDVPAARVGSLGHSGGLDIQVSTSV